MKGKLICTLIVVLAVVTMVCGCSLIPNKDAKFARKVIDAVYAGSLSPVQDSLTAQMQQVMSDQVIAQVGTSLNTQYGKVKGLKLKSTGPIENMTQKIWTVDAERGSFEMRLVMDADGKLAGLWFQPSTP